MSIGPSSSIVTKLIGHIGVGDRRQAGLVAILEPAPQLLSRHRQPTAINQGGVTEIDEADLTALVDAPTPSQFGGQAGLAPVRKPLRYPWCSPVHCRTQRSTRCRSLEPHKVPSMASSSSRTPCAARQR